MYKLANSLEQSPPSEANNYSSDQECPFIFGTVSFIVVFTRAHPLIRLRTQLITWRMICKFNLQYFSTNCAIDMEWKIFMTLYSVSFAVWLYSYLPEEHRITKENFEKFAPNPNRVFRFAILPTEIFCGLPFCRLNYIVAILVQNTCLHCKRQKVSLSLSSELMP